MELSAIAPETSGYYWCQVDLVNGGLPDVVQVIVDEFGRFTAKACGCERVFDEDDLLAALWSERLEEPARAEDAHDDFFDTIPF